MPAHISLIVAFLAATSWTQQQSAPPPASASQSDRSAPTTPATADSKPPRVRISGTVEEAALIHMVKPFYPQDAKDAHITGIVVLKGVIAKDGSLQNLEYVSGPDELKDAAIDAAKQWQYKPTTSAGNPVETEATIKLEFSLREGDASEADSDAPEAPDAPASADVPNVMDDDHLSKPPPPTHIVPDRIKVGGMVQAAKLLHQVLPQYPVAAKDAGITGTVRLHAIVAKDGSMKMIEYVSGPKELTDAAIDAVKQWRYDQTLLNDQPVEVDTTIDIVFSLEVR
jgi:TonB family protein